MFVYLAGDIGGYKTQDALDKDLRWDNLNPQPEDILVLLGDNNYPKGIPPQDDEGYASAIARMGHMLERCLQFFQPPIYVIPGNHDYNIGRAGGEVHWAIQKAWISESFPQQVETVSKLPQRMAVGNISLILLDTQQFLQKTAKSQVKDSLQAFIQALDLQLQASEGTYTILCGHHPFYSRAMHGGKFSLKEHLFPLSLVRNRLLIPFPILGSVIAMGRRTLGAKEDMRHPRYWRLRQAMVSLLSKYEHLAYAAGHDHNLQHYPIFGNHYIVSGSASKTAYVRPGGRADFVAKKLGCFRLGGIGDTKTIQAFDFEGNLLKEWAWLPLMLK